MAIVVLLVGGIFGLLSAVIALALGIGMMPALILWVLCGFVASAMTALMTLRPRRRGLGVIKA